MKKLIISLLSLICITTNAQDNTLRNGGEYFLYNTYYNRCLGGNAENNGPALSVPGENTANYVWVAEASSLDEGWYWLRHKETGKYLQASNAEGNTWSCWFAGSLNKSYNSYEWKLGTGIEGWVKSYRGTVVNSSTKCYLGIDKGAESKDYISVYYDKEQGEIATWQVVDANYPIATSRLKLYTDMLDDVISRGEDIYNNSVYGKPDELAVALYNARSAKETASLNDTEVMVKAASALEAAISNALEGKYKILISGSSFGSDEKFIVFFDDINDCGKEEKALVMRNSKKKGVVAYINNEHIRIGDKEFKTTGLWDVKGVYFSFDGQQVSLCREDQILGTAPMTEVPTMTSVGTSAEISIIGEQNITKSQIVFFPGMTYDNPVKNKYGKLEPYVLYSKGERHDREQINADIHYLCTNNIIGEEGSSLDINSDSTWIIFDNIRPSDVIANILPNLKICGEKAVNGKNCRVAIYLHGTVVYAYSPQDVALYGYSGEMFSGEEYQFKAGKNSNMGEAANMLKSFILKRGYMVCFSTNADGSGYSRVYVADHEDKKIEVLPDLLKDRISRAYVRKWNWVSKKGWCNTTATNSIVTEGKLLGCTWFYTWGADRTSQTDMEYVPHRNHVWWPSWSSIDQENATAVLGYNEPDHSEQHSDDCGKTIDAWTACTHQPEFMECGLRVGSPAPTDASWLTNFIKHCDDMSYRCDFVAFHAYWGTNEAANSDSWWWQLEQIYKNTGRPIWLTEWNNGASWTTESWPSSYNDKLTKQKNAIKYILSVLDNANFIERYSLYNWDSYYRAAISWDSDKNSWWVTPCGEVYRDTHPKHAYQESMQKVPVGWFPSTKKDNTFDFTVKAAGRTFTPVITNNNGDYTATEIIEYKDVETGEWKVFYDNSAARAKFDKTDSRTETIKLDDCDYNALTTDELTLRLHITTLGGGDTTTESKTVTLPEYIKTHYKNEVGINDIHSDQSEKVYYSLDGRIVKNPVSGQLYIYDNKVIKY